MFHSMPLLVFSLLLVDPACLRPVDSGSSSSSLTTSKAERGSKRRYDVTKGKKVQEIASSDEDTSGHYLEGSAPKRVHHAFDLNLPASPDIDAHQEASSSSIKTSIAGSHAEIQTNQSSQTTGGKPNPQEASPFHKYWNLQHLHVRRAVHKAKDQLIKARRAARANKESTASIDAQYTSLPDAGSRVPTVQQWQHSSDREGASKWQRAYELAHDDFYRPKPVQSITEDHVRNTLSESHKALDRIVRNARAHNDKTTAQTLREVKEVRDKLPSLKYSGGRIIMKDALHKSSEKQRVKWQYLHQLTHDQVNGKRQ
jgi:hypothetical protein